MSNLWRRAGELMVKHGLDYLKAMKHARSEALDGVQIAPETLERSARPGEHVDWCSSRGPYLSRDCTCPCQGCDFEIDNYPGHMHNREAYDC